MAAVRIEEEAFSDPRLELLGSIAGYNRFEALGRMANLWRVCTNRCSYVLSEANVVACLGSKGVDAIIQADLGEREADGIRIKGTRGRIEWLRSKREAGRKGGEANRSKGEAEPKQTEAEGKQKPSKTKPLTLAPVLTPTLVPIHSLAEDIAASPLVDEKPVDPKPTTPRTRCLLWDAIVSITGADASIKSVAAHIGRVRKALTEAKPPYTPEEVLSLPDVAATQLPWAAGRSLTLGEIEKNIGLVRSSPQSVKHRKPSPVEQTADALKGFLERHGER